MCVKMHMASKKMGLANIPAFYGQNGSIEELLLGLNFGSAEATIMKPSSMSRQSLNQQLEVSIAKGAPLGEL
ncbi:hypothetical protein CJ030_MR1G022249 [Morella rubra]|uniref:Uncharacterized protein n=1 Tax=Morella rubra TaxID=262757 RepID=A0A6A1WT12_9ROSI|nr:hypothetical protein CJ030_MR1G022249 [Morella rubra]